MSTEDIITKFRNEAIKLREDNFEFQGLEREFKLFQEQLLSDYERSSGLKHPVNRGDAREDYLKILLSEQGLIPDKFGISEVSSRVVSSSGHHSKEIDILIYDKPNKISLLKYKSTEFYPVEFVYGVIQVKSSLRNKKTVKDGLENIASFKRLKKDHNGCSRGFGILFAYEATLKWSTIMDTVKEFMQEHPSTEWPNAIVILTQGTIAPVGENNELNSTAEIDKFNIPKIGGIYSQGDCLLRFYLNLMELLRRTKLGDFDLSKYIRLPFRSGNISYSFCHEFISEIGNCDKHGQYLRQISEESLKKIIQSCKDTEPINWIKAHDIAYGYEGNDIEKYHRQPGDVLIYNPENLPLSKVLLFEDKSKGLSYDCIIIENKQYFIPYTYSIKDNLITMECPKCKKAKLK